MSIVYCEDCKEPIHICKCGTWGKEPQIFNRVVFKEDKVETILVKFCAEIYKYAHKKNKTYGEDNEYFITLAELDRIFVSYLKENQ